MEIRSKREFFDLWRAGVLGNRTQLFTDLGEALRGTPDGRVGFREIGKAGGGAWERGEDAVETTTIYHRWVAAGRNFLMDDGVPNECSTLQGEINRGVEGLYGFIAVGNGMPPMRISMARGLHEHFYRVQVLALMNHFMDPSSKEDILDLLDIYPDATIEFTCFDVNVGNVPNRNTMIWEVRNY